MQSARVRSTNEQRINAPSSEPPEASQPSERLDGRERVLRTAAALAVLAAALTVLLRAFPPLQDFPEWMYQGWLLKELALGNEAVSDIARLAPIPVPNSTLQLLLAGLNFAVDPITAGRLTALLYLLVGYAGTLAISRAAPAAIRGSTELLLVLCLVLSSRFWNGYLAAQLGLWMIAWLLLRADSQLRRGEAASPRWLAGLALAGVAIFFTHGVAYGAYLLALGWLVLTARQPQVLAAAVPSALLAGWYALGRSALPDGGVTEGLTPWLSLLEAIPYKVYTAAKYGPFVNFYSAPGASALQEWPALYWSGAVLNLLCAAALCLLAAWALVLRRRELWLRAPVASGTAAVCFAAFALLPFRDWLGVVNLGERVLGVALIASFLALVRLVDPPVRALRTTAVLCAVALPYLLVPAWILEPQLRAHGEVGDWAAEYYSDQRFFNSRPNQLLDRFELLRERSRAAGAAAGLLPLYFKTSLLVQPPELAAAPPGPSAGPALLPPPEAQD
jgi:hypothetical protein